jgi:hypothetical protein
MAYAMARVVAFLCIALLVAHVDSARMLKQVTGDTTTAMTAEAFMSQENVEDSDPSKFEVDDFGTTASEESSEAVPNPVVTEETPYNYATEDTTTSFADDGVLVNTEDTAETSEFSDQESTSVVEEGADDQVTSFATEETVTEGKLIHEDSPEGYTESLAEDKSGSEGFLITTEDTDSNLHPYVFDAQRQDAAEVEPKFSVADDSGASEFQFTGDQSGDQNADRYQTTSEPVFDFEEKQQEFGN